MENVKTQQEVNDFTVQLLERSWSSAQFKSDLIENPKATMEELKGKELVLPENINIIVTDQSDPNNIYINIPPNPEELNSTQLDNIVGGCNPEGDLIAVVGNGIGHGIGKVIKFFRDIF